ncbi:TDT family transporter [Nakamurella sp. A5-74]|uniref:TDT family transporter n=1 Tax=Nakamurella sp. A5-74 TaxID=3158264 RepID=A0AAU8DQX7_9ACTN
MSMTVEQPDSPQLPRPAGRLVLRDLQAPGQAFAHITPNWFASVMGTGIVATAAATLPVQFPGLRGAATVVWALAALLLIWLTVATAVHWRRHRAAAVAHHLHPVMAPFYGAPPMALMTVGAGTLLLGTDVIGSTAAVAIDMVLWTAGTVLGLVTAVAVPYLTFTRHDVADDSAFGGWLMPVVPPMVSAATGALLLPHVPPGQLRLNLLLACYAMFGLSLISSLIIITLIWARLARHRVGPAGMVPTLWIVLGPIGQSITAANLLGGNAHLAVPAPWSTGLEVFGVIYGLPMLGFLLLWTAVAAAITVRTARQGLPFSLTWWSFTFPVGTCVTGLSGLTLHTGSVVLRVLAAGYYAFLVAAWTLVAVRTFHGSVIRGTLLIPPGATPRPDGQP